MFKHFQDYYWKEGKPYGRKEVDSSQTPYSYKIIVDPYYKRFSIEKYYFAKFDRVIYDSYLLDFRHLTLKDQMAWQREVLREEKDLSVCLLRNQDDRAILIETLLFEGEQCRECTTRSVHGIDLCIHRMYYRSLQDRFNGVVLYDNEGHPVMMKMYETDPLTGEFTNLLFEEWNMQEHATVEEILNSINSKSLK
jgi:hypothetical protein